MEGAISWVLKMQTVMALSTTETEYMEATQACKRLYEYKDY